MSEMINLLFKVHTPADITSDPNIAVTLSFFAGLILIMVGLLRLGFMVNFISHPVITGFICSAAITIPGNFFTFYIFFIS